jgi:hypothetical protein
MSGNIIGGIIGGIIGFFVGGPAGAFYGFAAGSAVGSIVDPTKLPTQYGPRLGDKSIQSSTYGVAVAFLFGRPRVAGTVIWAEELKEVTTTTSEGKGGPSQTVVTYTYFATFAVMLGFGPALAVHRIWGDAVEIFSDEGSPIEGIEVHFVFYPGDEGQLPDPTIESQLGVGNTPAYRGYTYLVFNELPLEKFGNRIPNITVDIQMEDQTLAQCITRLAVASGLTADDIDVSAFVTRGLNGYVVAEMGPARAAIEQLATTFLFEACESDDKLVFVPRGGPILQTFDLDDCGAGPDASPGRPVQLQRRQEIDLPDKFTVSAPDPARNYQPGTQPSERIASRGGQSGQWQTAAALSSDQARQLATVLVFDAWASRDSLSWVAPRPYSRLTPTDVVSIDGRRVRITKRADDGGSISFEGVTDDPDVLDQSGIIGINGGFISPPPPRIVPTEMVLVETSLLRDIDDTPGSYCAVWGQAPYWQGAAIFKSADGVTWVAINTAARPGTSIGTATNVLGAWTGGDIFDMGNSVNVRMDNGLPASLTRAAVLAGSNGAAVECTDGSWELIQYMNATLQTDGTYTLSGLLRGVRGTEWAGARGHSIGDRVVLVNADTGRSLNIENSEIGSLRKYKGVTIGSTLADSIEHDFTIAAERLKPLSPVDLRAARAIGSGDITFSWKRRTRISVRFAGAGGISVPLGEDSELYVMEIYADGSYASLLRTISGLTTASAPYSAADQVSDGFTLGHPIPVRIYQISGQVGRGHPLEAQR